MSNIVLAAETGSDIPASLAKEKGIHLVPMHVSMGDRRLDDGTFSPKEVCFYFDKTGKLPKTSGCTPDDFTKVFDRIHKQWPQKEILHLAYSAVTTCSYQSAHIAAEGRDYVASVDTMHVSAGQGAIVIRMADLLAQNPSMSLRDAVETAKHLRTQARMCFLPDDLKYLKAGGRVSNAASLVGRLLNIHPRIEIIDGHLVGTKKHRGDMDKLVPNLIHEYSEEQKLNRDHLWLMRSPGLSDSVCRVAEKSTSKLGYKSWSWVDTGSVITTHGGPRAFGMVGFSV